MTFDVLGDLNWLAVIVAAIAYFLIGGVWFTPFMFGRPWQRSIGWEPTDDRPGPAIYLAPLLACLVAAIALAMLANATGTDTFGEGIVLGLVTGIGLVGTVLGVTAVFEPTKPQAGVWFVISAAYHVVGFLIASAILAVWD